MTGSHLDKDDSTSNAYILLLLLTGLMVATYALVRFVESKNRLNYDNRFARVIAGLLTIMVNMMHTKSGDLEIPEAQKTIIALGPHRTGWEAVVVASKMKGTPPRFFASTQFEVIPGISSFMKMFKTISVETHATKNSSQSANANALEKASKVLDKKGCVALFPQGNFSKLDQEPPRIYAGAARLALKNKVPINVYRLDGFWCLQNSLIPIFIRNNTYYRAFFSMLHMNKVRTTLCSVIDFHLQSENEHLSDDEKITAICAELYAYYRHTEELTDKQIGTIKTEISEKAHLLIWKNKVQQDDLAKQRLDLKKEEKELVQPTLELMKSMK